MKYVFNMLKIFGVIGYFGLNTVLFIVPIKSLKNMEH